MIQFGPFDSEPVRIELDCQPGASGERPFEVDITGPYEINVLLERVPGLPSPWSGSDRNWIAADIAWQVTTGSREVARGESADQQWNHFGGADVEGQTVGQFDAERQQLYLLQYQVNAADASLKVFNPHLVVWANNRREPFHSRFFGGQMFFSLGVSSVVGGVLIVAIQGVRSSFRVGRSHTA